MDRSSRVEWALFLLVLAAALVPRLSVAAADRSALESDERTYDKYAWSFALDEPRTEKGQEIYHPLGSFTYRPPGYPLFMGLIYRAVGHEPRAVRLAQAVVGALTCGFVYLLGRDIFGRRVGLLAALLVAASPMLIQLTAWVLSETLFNLCLVVALWAAVMTARAGRWGAAVVAGLALGLATIVRPLGLAVAGFIVVWLLVARLPRRRRLALAGLVVVAGALVVGPIVVKNQQIHQRLVLVSTHGGITFWRGLLKGGAARDPELAMAQDRIAASGLDEVAQEQAYYQVAFDYLRRYPDEIPILLRRKAEQFLLYVDDEYEIAHKKMPVWQDPLAWRLLLLLGVLGAVVFPRRHVYGRALLVGAGLVQVATTLIYDTTVRYRAPLWPVLALLAAFAVVALAEWSARSGPRLRHRRARA